MKLLTDEISVWLGILAAVITIIVFVRSLTSKKKDSGKSVQSAVVSGNGHEVLQKISSDGGEQLTKVTGTENKVHQNKQR